MFSAGHLMWIGVSVLIIIAGSIYCLRQRPPIKKLMTVCLAIGAVSEVIKVFSVADIVPMVDAVIVEKDGKQVIDWVATGRYTPYLAKEHLPLELCSLFLFFMLLAIVMNDGIWKKRLYSLMFVAGTIGGVMGIVLASITRYYDTPLSYFTSARAWQFFLYHSMLVIIGIYLGYGGESGLEFGDWKKAVCCLVALDIPSFYLNSALSSEIYVADKVVGVTHSINFFSTYVNPLGLVLTEKWQWIVYLIIRLVLAGLLILLLFATLKLRRKEQV